METPSSTRKVTRSQIISALNGANNNNFNIPISKSEKDVSKSRQRNVKQQQDRSALVDVTNDSPIVGLAMETPSSAMAKKKNSRIKRTPGSGEALLRGQVKTLLQKVEEEAELTKISMETRPFIHLVNSPMGLLAPTPANTPQVPDGDSNFGTNGIGILITSQMVRDISEGKEESFESQKSLSITRSLLLDFSDKSESSDSSECSYVVTHKGESESNEKSPPTPDDENSSVWSMQVNASFHDEEDDDQVEEEEYEEDGKLVLDGLCEGMSEMSVKTMAEFGKHTRFVYDSEDENVEREEKSPGVLRLKGLPTPKGKHFRFDVEEDDSVVGK